MNIMILPRVRLAFVRILSWLGLAEDGIYYVNGPDTLPPPLEADEENEAISALESRPDNAEIRGLLIERNLRLVVYIARKFESTGIGIEDLVSIGTIGLIKAIGSFRSDKGIKLATYASRCIENEILMYIRKTSSRKGEVSLDEPLNIDGEGNELLLSEVLGSDSDIVSRQVEREDECRLLRLSISTLNKREQQIMNMRFGLDGYNEHTQKEVADILGISQSYISRLEKKIINNLKKQLANI